MRRVTTKFVLKLLPKDQNKNKKQIAIDLLECAESTKNFFK